MPNNRLPALVLAAIFLCAALGNGAAAAAAAENSIKSSLVKIFNVESAADYDLPWNMLAPAESYGSGCIIDGRLILTNAHVVSDSTYLEVKPYGSAQSYAADVVAVSHEADLALLTVEDEGFWTGRSALPIGRLPEALEELTVYGFPAGGESLSLSRGIVSRIEVFGYAHSGISMLQVQIDAAVNPGNSGGPAVIKGAIAGVISEGYDDLQNVNYMVPPPVIEHFLADIEDGRYDGFPDLGVHWQRLENDSHRSLYGLPDDNTGILVIKVLAESPAAGKIHPLDVITAVDGREIASDGTVELRPGERVSHIHFIRLKRVGEAVELKLVRKGKALSVTVDMTRAWDYHYLSYPMKYDRAPSYLVYGGMVFTPLTENFLATWGDDWAVDAPSHLLTLNEEFKSEECEQAIILSKVLPHDLNRGFEIFVNSWITHLNGKKLLNMQDLVHRIETERDSPFLVFTRRKGKQIVLNRERVEALRDEIHEIYGVGADRSEDLAGSGGSPWLDASCRKNLTGPPAH